MSNNIRDEIVQQRGARLAMVGHDEGASLPARREVPLVPFLGADGLICEVKRRSPSKGAIADGLDAVAQAGLYFRSGARNLSVLTVPEGFGGSLEDLVRVKRAFPGVAVLRKDFLFDEQDIDASWRAGADAVLLIAGMLPAGRLEVLYRRARSLGMQALVEVHDREDLAKAATFAPDLVGINSRDLATFRIDPLLPVAIRAGIKWEARVVYESGVSHPEHAAFVAGCGFQGLLVGEAVVRRPELAGLFGAALRRGGGERFWPEIGRRLFQRRRERPLVKICGLTRERDARLASDLGADILGFVFWPGSPRRVDPPLLARLRDLETPKVGVVVNPPGAGWLDCGVRELLEEGLLDAVQFHGGEGPDDCPNLWPVYYKAHRPGSAGEAAGAEAFRCPRVLLDASAEVPGGSGKRVAPEVLDAWRGPLWLAGGINAANAGAIARERRPELIDVASGVEEAPGIKRREALLRLFMGIVR